jgi:hypothetical protein
MYLTVTAKDRTESVQQSQQRTPVMDEV